MGQVLGGGERRDNVDESMIQDYGSDEVVSDVTDVMNITMMRDDSNVNKMEVLKNSTKNGHLTEVR